jgi:hypothetical protein
VQAGKPSSGFQSGELVAVVSDVVPLEHRVGFVAHDAHRHGLRPASSDRVPSCGPAEVVELLPEMDENALLVLDSAAEARLDTGPARSALGSQLSKASSTARQPAARSRRGGRPSAETGRARKPAPSDKGRSGAGRTNRSPNRKTD